MALKRFENTFLTNWTRVLKVEQLAASIHASATDEDELTDKMRETAMVPLNEKSRTFEKSKTVSNVVLPLKLTRMANPFPDPVKSMSSQIISDKDRSDQMLAEAKHCLSTFRNNYFK